MWRNVAVIGGRCVLWRLVVATLLATAIWPTAAGSGVTPPAAAEDGEDGRQLDRHNYIVGMAQMGVLLQQSNSTGAATTTTACGRELAAMLEAVAHGDYWSLKVIDSYGGAAGSFAWGNYFWFASRDFCDDLSAPYTISFSHGPPADRNRSDGRSPFPLRFRMVYLNFSSPHYVDLRLPFEHLIHLGVCLPASCSAAAVMRFADAYFRRNAFEMQRQFALQLHPIEARTPAFDAGFLLRHPGSVIFIAGSLLAIILAVLAEFAHRAKVGPPTKTPPEGDGAWRQLLLCFRLADNYERAMRPDTVGRNVPAAHSVSAISGLRTIVCLWVTIFHVYYYSLYAMDNVNLIFAKLEGLLLQPVMQACFYVDVFFVISALLHVYHFLSREADLAEIRRNRFAQNLKLFARTLLRRYMRLTPVLVVVMLASDLVYELLNMYSPFRLGEHSGIYCKHNWWYNLLYIQNLLDMRDICCSWTWYLACEMQYFVLSTALLFLHAKHPKTAKVLFVVAAGAFALFSFLCNYLAGITFQIDVVHSTLDALYVKPWVRINPYVAGAAFGWILHRAKHLTRPAVPLALRGRAARAAFWTLCGIVYVATNYMSYWRGTPSLLVAAIMSGGKLVFASCVGMVIVLCATGHGGWLNALLSARPGAFLNKFCYSVYMGAPVIIFATFGLRNEASTFTEVGSGVDFLAILPLSIAVGILLVLVVELPMQRVADTFLRPRRPNSSRNDQNDDQQPHRSEPN